MALKRTRDMPLSKPIKAQFIDAYMRHSLDDKDNFE